MNCVFSNSNDVVISFKSNIYEFEKFQVDLIDLSLGHILSPKKSRSREIKSVKFGLSKYNQKLIFSKTDYLIYVGLSLNSNFLNTLIAK